MSGFNLSRVFFAAMIAASVFWAGCSNGDDKEDEKQKEDVLGTVISGTLSGASANSMRSANLRKFSGEVQNDNSISGKLEDGDMVFNLKGQYDPDSKEFNMQAASSNTVFSIVGRLNADGNVDPTASQATVEVKSGGEWNTIILEVNPSDVTISGAVNQSSATTTPTWSRGTWYDQLSEYAVVVTENTITIQSSNDIQVITIVEAEEVGAGAVRLIARAILPNDSSSLTAYTAKFYVADSFDATLNAALGNTGMGGATISSLVGALGSGEKIFVAAYSDNNLNNVIPFAFTTDGYSPMFKTTAAAKAATNIRHIPSFTLALMRTQPDSNGNPNPQPDPDPDSDPDPDPDPNNNPINAENEMWAGGTNWGYVFLANGTIVSIEKENEIWNSLIIGTWSANGKGRFEEWWGRPVEFEFTFSVISDDTMTLDILTTGQLFYFTRTSGISF